MELGHFHDYPGFLPAFLICDGIAHCADMGDEEECFRRFQCAANDGKISIPIDKKCDGNTDCFDGSDEDLNECPGRFFCSALNGTKVSFHYRQGSLRIW